LWNPRPANQQSLLVTTTPFVPEPIDLPNIPADIALIIQGKNAKVHFSFFLSLFSSPLGPKVRPSLMTSASLWQYEGLESHHTKGQEVNVGDRLASQPSVWVKLGRVFVHLFVAVHKVRRDGHSRAWEAISRNQMS
jgi:hypothetical protein